ncbi:MAG: NAD-dependent dihydropyrimidine dehydrogenase subunit PreA [Firmicutes bacterium]|jgi:dihydropyrimidine dehydrogenase (NAD+) subunit PreA|nr:NAD-dependent dihydropyrimidine dehydrogenase subunit PreA [Bacillota bacterium]NBI62338.1 NAD-dependent dihydropyrimidine dehydrogenase subunit PreA [Clostridiales bacterium]
MAFKKDLSIEFAGVKCLNPFFLASSPVCNNYDMIAKAFEAGWAGVFYKNQDSVPEHEISPIFGVTDMGGPWSMFKNCEHASQNSFEQNAEFMHRLKRDYPEHRIFATLMGGSDDDWKKLVKMAAEVGIDGVELNMSCPHMGRDNMGSDVGCNPDLVEQYARAARSVTDIPIIAKMTPNITNMIPSAMAAVKGGASGVSAINTVKSIIDIDKDLLTTEPVVNGKSAISGLSGKAVKPIALRFINEMAQYPGLKDVPISGVGGVYTWEDALDFLLLGARNVQICTSVMEYGYRILEDIISGISYWMEEKGFEKLDDFVGMALRNITTPSEFTRTFKIRPAFDHDTCIGCGRCYVSCYDGGHQAIDWDDELRRPSLNTDRCVGCHLCQKVCPVPGCITPGEVAFDEGATPENIVYKKSFR